MSTSRVKNNLQTRNDNDDSVVLKILFAYKQLKQTSIPQILDALKKHPANIIAQLSQVYFLQNLNDYPAREMAMSSLLLIIKKEKPSALQAKLEKYIPYFSDEKKINNIVSQIIAINEVNKLLEVDKIQPGDITQLDNLKKLRFTIRQFLRDPEGLLELKPGQDTVLAEWQANQKKHAIGISIVAKSDEQSFNYSIPIGVDPLPLNSKLPQRLWSNSEADDNFIPRLNRNLEILEKVELLIFQLEAIKLEADRVEAQRVEAQRVESEILEAERLVAERLEAQRMEAQKLEAERLEAERLVAQRLEAQRLEARKLEAQRSVSERLAPKLEAIKLKPSEAKEQSKKPTPTKQKKNPPVNNLKKSKPKIDPDLAFIESFKTKQAGKKTQSKLFDSPDISETQKTISNLTNSILESIKNFQFESYEEKVLLRDEIKVDFVKLIQLAETITNIDKPKLKSSVDSVLKALRLKDLDFKKQYASLTARSDKWFKEKSKIVARDLTVDQIIEKLENRYLELLDDCPYMWDEKQFGTVKREILIETFNYCQLDDRPTIVKKALAAQRIIEVSERHIQKYPEDLKFYLACLNMKRWLEPRAMWENDRAQIRWYQQNIRMIKIANNADFIPIHPTDVKFIKSLTETWLPELESKLLEIQPVHKNLLTA